MAPLTISYKDFIRNAKNKVDARLILQKQLRTQRDLDILNISATARLWKCSRKTIRGLLNNVYLDYEARKAPKSCPHKTADSVTFAITSYSKQHGYGACLVKLNMNLKLPSIPVIHRILKDGGLTRKNRAYKRKRQARFLKKNLKPFQKWQLDTKYLTDIPNLIPLISKAIAPMYEYTLRDMSTGTTFLGYGFRERSLNDTLSFLTLALYHMQLHGIDTHYVTIQSDNGPEMLGNINQKERYRIAELVEDKFGGVFKTIPIRRPTYNSHVESFHRRVEPEAYDLIANIKSLDEFINYMQGFTVQWNTKRRAMKYKKTPLQIAKNRGFLLEDCFYNFPILVFDKIQLSLSGTYLPLKSTVLL